LKIIAEMCQNHNGDDKTLFKMVDAAAEAGASHIKMQHIYTKNLTFRPQFEEGLSLGKEVQSIKRPYQHEFNRLKSLEISGKTCEAFVKHVERIGLIPVTTCFARSNIEEIIQQGFREIKVASYDCASYQLIRDLSKNFRHLYISTGATFENEIYHTYKILRELNISYDLLHCVSLYPTPLEKLNLLRIKHLKKYSRNVGFSDHSLVDKNALLASKAAIICGANIIERHFTILPQHETKDGPVSISSCHISELVKFSKMSLKEKLEDIGIDDRLWASIKGSGFEQLSDEELLNRDYYRGRFASPRVEGSYHSSNFIYNWEETNLAQKV